jgi:hypothetical protein
MEPATMQLAEQWINERRAAWNQRLDRLGQYLAETADEPAPEIKP